MIKERASRKKVGQPLRAPRSSVPQPRAEALADPAFASQQGGSLFSILSKLPLRKGLVSSETGRLFLRHHAFCPTLWLLVKIG